MHLLYAIHGILTRQTRADWPDQFDAWCAAQAVPARVEKREYMAGPFPWWNRHVRNPRLARACVAEIAEFKRARIGAVRPSFVAHSNGTDVALLAVQQLAERNIATDTLIVIGSVLHADVERNGVASLVRAGWLRRAVAYCSTSDGAISVGQFSTYGALGITGWTNNTLAGIQTRWFPRYGHGDYFTDTNRERTFALIKEDLCLP